MDNILITGGTGLVGTELVQHYLNSNSEIYVLTRSDLKTSESRVHYINWSKENWEEHIPRINIVINLAGANLNQRWTAEHKAAIMNSRVESTQRLYDYFAKQGYGPEVLFNASAVGYYPPSKIVSYDEYDQFVAHDYLSTVASRWEQTARLFENIGTRVVVGRFGVVLSNKGGALPTMAKPYQFFVGGSLGSGEQWMSWIHIADLIKGITTLIDTQDSKGVYNMCSPNPVRQKDLGKAIGKVMHRPHWLPAPAIALKILLGEQSTIILDVQKVNPKRLGEQHFEFDFPEIESAMRDLLT
ncbi:TIGR01777 family oxidoreductase [Mammaliicoccus sp. Dog046]|uniref:TIGR01777 family oxidoreductase n=1 Tax=Mammaliicoccus sp. Dog046 TaxID=3034233 RepID=UPI002B25991E|nr:TIGR01777 family oxidoreductase [Mammaliicoccus sp. Dog046]WQK85381.1 TIGR01777 family oxidoreductase [Mammaliicoccus sp. Dog046]